MSLETTTESGGAQTHFLPKPGRRQLQALVRRLASATCSPGRCRHWWRAAPDDLEASDSASKAAAHALHPLHPIRRDRRCNNKRFGRGHYQPLMADVFRVGLHQDVIADFGSYPVM